MVARLRMEKEKGSRCGDGWKDNGTLFGQSTTPRRSKILSMRINQDDEVI
jgi:hypothetical protein